MSPRFWAFAVFTSTATVAVGYFVTMPLAGQEQVQVSTGRELYAANCARCHGANLEGQPNWMERNADGLLPAPPHDETGHTWHHSDKQLFTITKFGLEAIAPGYKTDMPAFENVLTDDEITAILEYIKSTWPERARAYQEARSASDVE